MSAADYLHLDDRADPGGGPVLRLAGAWRMRSLAEIETALAALRSTAAPRGRP